MYTSYMYMYIIRYVNLYTIKKLIHVLIQAIKTFDRNFRSERGVKEFVSDTARKCPKIVAKTGYLGG